MRGVSGGRLLAGLFLFNLLAFALFAWAMERWEGDMDWGTVVGGALVMGIVVTDLSARFGKVDRDEIRPTLRAWAPALRITFWFWACLIGALALSVLFVVWPA